MQAVAKLRFAHISAQKGRLVADQIRGLPVEQALNLLMFSKKKGATMMKRCWIRRSQTPKTTKAPTWTN